jgi:hypothetical protein
MKHWDRSCHSHPCSETDRLDVLLNELNESSITLSPADLQLCSRTAARLQSESERKRLRNLRVSSQSDLEVHLMGTMGELAARKYFHLPSSLPVNTFRLPDLPGNIEVRAHKKQWYLLRVRPSDDDARRMVMAIVDGSPTVRLAGWIVASDAKKSKITLDPNGINRPFHAVPQDELLPMSSLRSLINPS